MKGLRIVAYVLAGILLVFGVLFLLAAFGQQFQSGWLITGLILIGLSLALIIISATLLKPKVIVNETKEVVVNVDLPGNVRADVMKCRQCGGTLAAKDVTLVNGAPVVTCPYCNSIYQLTEEPKW